MRQAYKSLEMHTKFLRSNLREDVTQVQNAILDRKAK
jgi:hypothetical protein